jgi:hypothetical protein
MDRDDVRSGELAGADEVSFGSRRPAGRWRSGWLLLAAGAVLVAVVAVVAVVDIGHGKKPPRTRPAVVVSEVGHRLLGVTAGWELFGYGPGGVVRIQFARGRVMRTAVPAVGSTGPVSFVVGPGQVIIRPLDFVPGYLVPDGHPARSLSGALSHGGMVIPGPRPGTVWVQAGYQATSMPLARPNGSTTGVSMRLPRGGSWVVAPDGRGYALVQDVVTDDYYDVLPGSFRRIAGRPLAVGPTRWLTVDCRPHQGCSNVVVDPASGARRTLPGPAALPAGPPGVIAPDGSMAAVMRIVAGRVALHLINLASGASRQVTVSLGEGSAGDQTLAWSPDSRWLFVIAAHGALAAVNARTLRVGGPGVSLPPVSQIAVRNSQG